MSIWEISMRRNSQYLRTRNTHDSESLGGEDVGKSREQRERELTEKVFGGLFESDDDRTADQLSVDLSGLTKSETELDAERRKREREDLAERIAEKLVEKTRTLDRRETVSKAETPDPVEACDRTLDALDELIARTEDGEELNG